MKVNKKIKFVYVDINNNISHDEKRVFNSEYELDVLLSNIILEVFISSCMNYSFLSFYFHKLLYFIWNLNQNTRYILCSHDVT